MEYNTNNPVPSSDPRDLFDNAQNLDQAVNSQESNWTDRFGRKRITLQKALESTPLAVEAAESAKQSAEEAKQAAGSINMPNLADSQPGDSLVVKDDKSGYRYQKVLNQVSALPTTDIGDVHLIGSGPYKWDTTQSKYVPLTTAASGKTVGKVEKFESRAHLQKELATPRDGQLVPRTLFPDFVRDYLDNGTLPVVTNANWLADTSLRTSWVANDGNGNFRVPDWNGKQPGSVAVYGGRGDGAKSNGVHGKIQFDQVQGMRVEMAMSSYNTSNVLVSTDGVTPQNGTSVDTTKPKIGSLQVSSDVTGVRSGYALYNSGRTMTDGVNGTPRVGDETRVTAPTVVWGVYLSNATETTLSPAQVDVLVGQYSALNAEVQTFKGKIGAVELYPNGTSAAPGTIGVSGEVYIPNPFPGNTVSVQAYTLIDGNWGTAGWYAYFSGGDISNGVSAGQIGDRILIAGGTQNTYFNGKYSGSSHRRGGGINTPLPFKILVTKVSP